MKGSLEFVIPILKPMDVKFQLIFSNSSITNTGRYFNHPRISSQIWPIINAKYVSWFFSWSQLRAFKVHCFEIRILECYRSSYKVMSVISLLSGSSSFLYSVFSTRTRSARNWDDIWCIFLTILLKIFRKVKMQISKSAWESLWKWIYNYHF